MGAVRRRGGCALACALAAASLAVVEPATTDPVRAAFPGQDGRIAMSVSREGGCWIATMEADGSDVQFLDVGREPAFSPDGARIAYVSNDFAGHSGVWTMTAAGDDFVFVGPGNTPAWSPDGKRIAVMREVEIPGAGGFVTTAIFALALDGEPDEQLTFPELAAPDEVAADSYPTWSPDGTHVTFVRQSERSVLYSLELSTQSLTQLTGFEPPPTDPFHDPYVATKPDYSPDGTKIAYTNFYANPNRNGSDENRPFVIGSGGGLPSMVWSLPDRGITEVPEQAWGKPTWSPSGTLVYLRDDGFFGPPGYEVVTGGGAVLFVTPGKTCITGLSWGPLSSHGELGTSFTFSHPAPQTDPGLVSFTSTTTGGAAPYSWHWDFSDGGESGQPNPSHRFETPGRHTVTLTVTDAELETATFSMPVDIAAPELAVEVSLPDLGAERPGLGDTVAVHVRVAASGAGVGPLRDLAFVGDPLQFEPSGKLVLVGGPTPQPGAPFSLEPGDEAGFDFTVQVAGGGPVTISSTIAGVDAAGAEVEQTGSVATEAALLKVTVVLSDTSFELDHDEQGRPVPKPVAATVSIENLIDEPITLVSQPPIPGEPVQDPSPIFFDISPQGPNPLQKVSLVRVGGPDPEIRPGPIAGHEIRTVTYALEGRDDGDLRVLASVSYADPSAPNPDLAPALRAGGTATLHIGEVKAFWTVDYAPSDKDNPCEFAPPGTSCADGLPWVRSGDHFFVQGEIRNLSTTDVIEVDPLTPIMTGNAGGGVEAELGTAPPDPTKVCAAPAKHRIEPGESYFFSAWVQTLPNLGSRGAVRYEPKLSTVGPNDTLTPIDPGQVLHTAYPDETGLPVHVDDGAPQGQPADWFEAFGAFGFGLGKGSVLAVAGVAYQALWDNPVTQAYARLWYLVNTVEYLSNAWNAATPADREAWLTQATGQLIASGIGADPVELYNLVDQGSQQFFTTLTTAYYGGDWRTFWTTLSEFGGEAVPQVIACIIAKDLVRTPSIVRLSDAEIQAARPKSVPAALKEIVAGEEIGPTKASSAWGQPKDAYEFIQKVADEYNVKILVKHSNIDPTTIPRVVETGAGTVAKGPPFYVKGVTQWDIDYLGYLAKDTGLVALKTIQRPIAEVEAAMRADGIPEGSPLWNEILSWRRFREYEVSGFNPETGKGMPGTAPDIMDWAAKGFVDMVWERQKNFTGDRPILNDVSETRTIALEADPAGGEGYFLVRLGDRGGGPPRNYVPSDQDLVAITDVSGKADDETTLFKIWDVLAKGPTQLAHPDSVLLRGANGEILFPFKEELMQPHLYGQGPSIPLLEFAPRQTPRAALIHPAYSFWDANGVGYIHTLGGYKSFSTLVPHFTRFIAYSPPTQYFLSGSRYLTPQGWMLDTPATGAGRPLGTCSWRYSNAPDAQVLQPDGDGGLRSWTPATGWTPADTSQCGASAGPNPELRAVAEAIGQSTLLLVAPQSALVGDVEAGSARVEIADPLIFDAEAHPGNRDFDWFTAGQRVVIDPGGAHEEFATVASGGGASLLFAAPLTVAHETGEMVSVVPAEVESQAPIPNASAFVATTPVRVVDTRIGIGAPPVPIAAGATVEVQITGAHVPPTATAVMINVTATRTQGAGWLQVMPQASSGAGSSSTLNVDRAGQTVANASFALLSPTGSIAVHSTFATDLVLDVSGYFVPAQESTSGRFVPLEPTRLVDTRSGLGWTPATGSTRLAAGTTASVTIAGRGGVPPSGVSAVVLNVTADRPSGAGFVQVGPTPAVAAAYSNLNTSAGRPVAGLVVVALGEAGTIDVYSDTEVDLIVDVVGYFTDGTAPTSSTGLFVPMTPQRRLDTRQPPPAPRIGAGVTTPIDTGAFVADAIAVAGNLTATESTAGGWLQVGAPPLDVGAASNLNVAHDDQTIANATIAGAVAGHVAVHTSAPTHMVFDVTGWFTAGSTVT